MHVVVSTGSTTDIIRRKIMTVNQISIFLENKPESLSQLTEVLAKNNINMRALSLADTSDFGIARIITDDCAAA
jgi:hypothetical protein